MELSKRKSNRLKKYDYSSNGAYFVTICTKDKKQILSKIVGDGSAVPKLTAIGEIIDEYINKMVLKYPMVNVDKYVIMPNHIHILLFIFNENGTANPSPTLGMVIGWFKYNVIKKANMSVFQRSFHDHIIRNKNDYEKIWQYIDSNPVIWHKDCFYNI